MNDSNSGVVEAEVIDTIPAGLEQDTETDALAIPVDEGADENLAVVLYFSSSAKGDRPTKLKEAGVALNNFYLLDNLGTRAFSPFRILPFGGQIKAWVLKDDKNKIVAAEQFKDSYTKPSKPGKWKEHTIGLVLVPNAEETSLTPAVLSTDDAQGRLWDLIREAQRNVKPEKIAAFAARDARYAAAAKGQFETARFVAHIWGGEEQKKDKTGSFIKGQSSIQPTSEKLRDLVDAQLADRGFTQGILKAFKRRVAKLEGLLAAKV